MSAVWIERRTVRPALTLNIAKQSKRTWGISRELKDWRAWAKEEAARLDPVIGPVAVTVHHLRKSRASMPDVGAPILAVKAIIDGLVDAHVLPGDGPTVVRSLTFEAPEVVGYHGLRVVVRPIEQHSTRDQPAVAGPLTLPITTPGDTTS